MEGSRSPCAFLGPIWAHFKKQIFGTKNNFDKIDFENAQGGPPHTPGALGRRPGYPASRGERAYEDEVDEVERPRGPAVWAGQRKGRLTQAMASKTKKHFHP